MIVSASFTDTSPDVDNMKKLLIIKTFIFER